VVQREDGREWFELLDAAAYFRDGLLAITERHYSLELRAQDMRRLCIDVQVLSPPTYLFRYDLPSSAAIEHCRAYNDALIAAIQSRGSHFWGLGILPLQVPSAAIAELERIIEVPEIIGVEIGTRIGTWELDAPELWPVYEAVAAHSALMLIHPSTVSAPERQQEYCLTHLVGLPAETTLAAARLLLAGVLDHFPTLNLCLAHAGGYLVLGIGRIDHAFRQVVSVQAKARRPPSEYLAHLYFDSVGHGREVLDFVVSQVGPEHMLMGSDYPAGTGLADPVRTIEGLRDLTTVQSEQIMGENLIGIVTKQRHSIVTEIAR
jgi:aminocarboxymuconate-semialdehyde decarboxylase